jgi:hypothetical protein
VEEVWARKDLALDMSSVVATGDRLCGLSHRRKGQPFCVGATTGETVWLGPPRFADHASVVAVPGALLFQLDSGELAVVDDEAADFGLLARVPVATSEVWAHPVPLSGGRLLIKSFERLELLAFD